MNDTLKQKWETLKTEIPNLRIRDAAKHLNVSEVELLTTGIGNGVKPLKPNFAEFLLETPKLGYVMALTRNESCVHERKGTYANLSVNGQTALAVGEDIDLRIFLKDWKFGFYVEDKKGDAITKSFQFFDPAGAAVHKIYKTEQSSDAGWESLKESFVDESTPLTLGLETKQRKVETNDKSQIPQFLEDWSKLEDTHDFFTLLRKYDYSREFSLEAAEGKFSFRISVDEFTELLHKVSNMDLEIMIFVGNPSIIQIHTGKIKNLQTMGPWFNVLDPIFNLHLRTDHIQTAYVVNKPTRDGMVTSIELFDKEGNLILQMFGKRKPGIPQSKIWFDLVFESIGREKNLNSSFV
ncbi:hemin-degrading factor [Leptospira jelokensis]|uniref:hemin-degrading factor n=1 Tax=Leptospira jelokensis TaxID=2484931 RepID=UPI0010916958|nr:ChuX/HutX family heme-like substrate-binding protein [Leptospira jelokensis]TGM03194.1 hemin-degrading factor [Leptospira jelokensis]